MCHLRRKLIITISVFIFGLAAMLPMALAADIPVMTKETLKDHLDKDDVVIVDVRQGRDWNSSEFKIKGAQRVEGKNLADWAKNQDKSKKFVLYCA